MDLLVCIGAHEHLFAAGTGYNELVASLRERNDNFGPDLAGRCGHQPPFVYLNAQDV